MSSIRPCALPKDALLSKYARAGAYTDCFTADIAKPVSHAAYVEAFYTCRLFKVERFLLTWLVFKPSTDAQARELASGASNSFAAWRVEERSANQLLVCDFLGQTRSWLMIGPPSHGGAGTTRLYFGTAVIPVRDKASGQARMSFAFKSLLPFHRLYSRALLYTARSRLSRIASIEQS
jgi:hypothetical protein